jgi:molybdopterin/thiamine biosynthesis adenylyltransferase
MFIMHKATELEETLDRIKNLEKLIEITQNQIGQVLGNMTAEGWYSSSTDKSEVLSDLCDIFDHEPKQEIRITGTMTFELRYDCPLDEVEDFDARYFAQDSLSLDSYNGNIIVESFDVEDADVDW